MSEAKIKVLINANTRPFRRTLDEIGTELGFIDEDQAEMRAMGRTLEEIDELETEE